MSFRIFKMGNQATTTARPAPSIDHHDIYTQIGQKNQITQTNSVAEGIEKINNYLFLFVAVFLFLVVFAMIRYINSCLNKRIVRANELHQFRSGIHAAIGGADTAV
ncbi:hypothetical protein O0L34_g16596 [Tuta absoluta]|nr:hypothetical protein O0L34_g16596 [Tuta absoluta]